MAVWNGFAPMFDDPFNADERKAQSLAGGGPRTAPIRSEMPEQHRLFFQALQYVAVATVGADGAPTATLLTGSPGFIRATDLTTLRIAGSGLTVAPGQPVGLLGIDFATRRRNRANGDITVAGPDGFEMHVTESFGNCPKYIQRRDVQAMPQVPSPVEEIHMLDAAARDSIATADTVFVASRARAGLGGIDISHRGGRPGFVRIDGNRLTIHEFDGNRYYNTLGNLLGDPRAAMLFVDFEHGDLLHLQGSVVIEWGAPEAAPIAGARPRWTFTVERGWRQRGAVPLSWSVPEPSPFLPGAELSP